MTLNKRDESPNTNCIEGWQCPECKSWGPFVVQATVWVQVHNDGTVPAPDYGGTEYDNASWLPVPDVENMRRLGTSAKRRSDRDNMIIRRQGPYVLLKPS